MLRCLRQVHISYSCLSHTATSFILHITINLNSGGIRQLYQLLAWRSSRILCKNLFAERTQQLRSITDITHWFWLFRHALVFTSTNKVYALYMKNNLYIRGSKLFRSFWHIRKPIIKSCRICYFRFVWVIFSSLRGLATCKAKCVVLVL